MDDHSLADHRGFDAAARSGDAEEHPAAADHDARALSPDPVPAPLEVDKAGHATSPQLAAAPAMAAVAVTAAPKRKGKARLVIVAALLAVLAGGAHYGWRWWTVGRFQESTDNAFLQADKVTVAPKVGGFVTAVFVGDNQSVKAGDVLAQIDERDFRLAVDEARADLEKAKAQLEGYKAAVIQQQSSVESAKADVVNAEAGLVFATQEAKRYKDLLASGAGTSQRAQQTDADLRQRTAALNKNRASLDASRKQVATYETLAASGQAAIEAAQAKLERADLDLSYTTIKAPIDGVVGDRSLRVGQLVQAGMGLLTVVPMGRDIYLVANFKETQLGQMTTGQPVEFTVDAFGDHVFHGKVDSFSPGTGAQFALLPPENATGNFTKVVQRVPVKITLDDADPLLPRLRPGLSVEATVEVGDTMHRDGRTKVGMAY